MSLLTKQSIESEIHYVDDLLSRAPANDVLGRLSLKGRIQELKKKLAELQGEWKKAAEVIVYFGGEPVCGSQSIALGFAADALSRFQELVSAIFASREGELSDMGPIPWLKESQLALAGMPRGSFGFLLQEQVDREPLTESKLEEAIQKAATLLEDISANESGDELELQAMNPRVFSSLKNFISCLSQNSASLSVVTSSKKISLLKENIKVSSEMIQHISEITSSEKTISGVFKGVTGIKRRFDFIPDNSEEYGSAISGKISKEIDDAFINTLNTEYMDKPCTAFFDETVAKKNDSSRPSVRWTLKDIRPATMA